MQVADRDSPLFATTTRGIVRSAFLSDVEGVLTTLRQRRLLVAAAVGAYALVFPAFVFLERPALGVGHFFYIPVGLLALASGPRIGALAGGIATILFAAGVFLNPYVPPTELATAGTAIRLITF